ncbi:hypothetical protein N7468_008537 [Penicillium chermesinum]|uniref:Uncharacterized protein n=1 Tax=Penicillium chermesinum TaxID=63820 RepID=A0A9W9NQ04_9EURO|nr:uncharacterized protein N7468_008537 [Penicillium chermesinum]KAJ5223995.1 hypothetical protein N7468_008537 [Penicillium chermesinum]
MNKGTFLTEIEILEELVGWKDRQEPTQNCKRSAASDNIPAEAPGPLLDVKNLRAVCEYALVPCVVIYVGLDSIVIAVVASLYESEWNIIVPACSQT